MPTGRLSRPSPRTWLKPIARRWNWCFPTLCWWPTSFHVVALVGRALHEVHGEKRRRGTISWLLHKGVEKLKDDQRSRLLESLLRDPQLARAWGLKEGLRAVYNKRRGDEAAAALDQWIGEAAL